MRDWSMQATYILNQTVIKISQSNVFKYPGFHLLNYPSLKH